MAKLDRFLVSIDWEDAVGRADVEARSDPGLCGLRRVAKAAITKHLSSIG